jgi:hypothetical protein
MSPLSRVVWAVPDLALLVCPASPDPWDCEFYVLYTTVLLEHHEKLRECGFFWAVSDELKTGLLYEFPWNAVSTVGWLRDLMVTFFAWLQEVGGFPAEHHPGAQTTPDIVPSYVSEMTKRSWLDVLVTCHRNDSDLCRVASFPQQTADRLLLAVDNAQPPLVVWLVQSLTEWDAVLADLDPWVRNGLPSGGEYPYAPPRHWHEGQPFPKQRCVRGVGFLDDNGRIWVWDGVEGHWDVQEQREGAGRYTRIRTDGLALP